ncbi:MAG: Fe-S cluster assembly protein SufD [Bacteroidota bacterium]
MSNKETFLSDLLDFQDRLNGDSTLLGSIRKQGLDRVKASRLPTPRDEDWRFTSLKPLVRTKFEMAQPFEGKLDAIDEYSIPESKGSRIVFINGYYSEEHSSLENVPEEVTVGNIADFADQDIVKEHLNQYSDYDDNPFVGLNDSYLNDGLIIHVPEGVKMDAPIQAINYNTKQANPYFTVPRLLLVAEQNSEMTLIEDHIGEEGAEYFTVPVEEVKLYDGAQVHHVRIQRDSLDAVHFCYPVTHVAKDSNYDSYTITLGAKLSRNEPHLIQTDEEVDFTVDGLVLIDGDQIADTHSVMDHRFSHADSHQLHKCVINGSAHSIFNGKIFVRQHAQKIDSFQENRNLLLSRNGAVNTKPQLEIFADDVLCSHGATIGQLEEDEVFYLKSRGLSDQKARELLTYAFALETIENVKVESVHKLLLEEVVRYTGGSIPEETVV